MLNTRFSRLALAGLCLVVISAVFSPIASAQRMDHGTKITINQPFEVSGTVLPAGTYVIRLMDVGGSQNVVEILNADETKAYKVVIGMPDFTFPKDPAKTEISFNEGQPGAPASMHAWFFPGDVGASEYGVNGVAFPSPTQ